MNPSSTNNSPVDMGMMTPWLHFGTSDSILLQAWRPTSLGMVIGSCIALILFSILERGLTAYRRTREMRWRARSTLTSSSAQSFASKGISPVFPRFPPDSARQVVPPFVPSRDILRGALQAVQSTFTYALMLVVMSFNGAYIISVVLGLGIGEVLFGRIARDFRAT